MMDQVIYTKIVILNKDILVTNEYYHVYNRTVANEQIFPNTFYLNRILELTKFYMYEHKLRFSHFKRLNEDKKQTYLHKLTLSPLVEMYAYSFMPNHFHFLLKQLNEDGIINFISNLQNSFAKYYNLKNKRTGSLFQRSFKAKRVSSTEEFVHINRYINLNHATAYLVSFAELKSYPYSSFPHYVNGNGGFLNTKYTKSLLGKTSFIKFCEYQLDYQRSLNKIKHLTID